MNSLANLNSVVDEQGDSAPWTSDQSWEPPAATMMCTGSLSDNRLHFHHSAPSRQEWDWSDCPMILPPHDVTEESELETKPRALQVDAMGGSGLGLRHYGAGGFMSAASSTTMVSPSVGTNAGVQSTAWPGLLNALPLRQQAGGMESVGEGCLSSPSLMSMYGGALGNAGGSGNHAGPGSYYNHALQSQMLDLDQQRRIQDILRRGLYAGGGDLGSGRLGLNLGGRTYFSAEDMGNRFPFQGIGKRFRPNSPSIHVPLCQAEGCKADLSIAKHYHRRHKVCEYHSKAATVVISGNTQRFCQQCSRFHALTEFDEGKRSCRKRLADHNRRRRKQQPIPAGASGDSIARATSTCVENNPSKLNVDQSKESKAGVPHADKIQSEHQGVHHATEDRNNGSSRLSSSPDERHATQILSPMTLAPPVSLTLQNAEVRPDLHSNQSTTLLVRSHEKSHEEAGYTNGRHPVTPGFLNGPSLSLSSSNVASARGADTVPGGNSRQSSPRTGGAPSTVEEGELSVPWLRGHHGASASKTGVLLQDCLGKISDGEGSLLYKIRSGTASAIRRNVKGEYLNDHRRLLAENMQNLHPLVRDRLLQDQPDTSRMESWMLEAPMQSEEQTVLRLLETSASAPRNKERHEYDRQINGNATTMNIAEQHHQFDEDQRGSGARHSLDFLQQHDHSHQHLSSATSTSDMDHRVSDAAISLQCMQTLRPLSESLYTTADFMKDGFV